MACLAVLGPWWAARPALGEDQNFNSSASATAAGWTGLKNTTGGNNFTWKSSNIAGGAAGEAGGTFKRVSSANAGWYADTTLGGILTLTNPISASGRLVITNAVNANQHWWLGHLGTNGFDGSGKNLIGFKFQERSASEIRVETVVFLKNGTQRKSAESVISFTGGNLAFFNYTYDPAGNGGLGRLAAELRNSASNTVYSVALNLSAGDKATDVTLNAFGAAEGAISDGLNYIDMYFDDLGYSTAPSTNPLVQFGSVTSSGLETSSPALLQVVLSQVRTQVVTVNYSITGGTATGGGVDYTLSSGTLVFNPGETSKWISVAVVGDQADEPDETILVTLAGVTGGVQLGPNATHTYTILNPPPPLEISIAPSEGGMSFRWPAQYAGYRLQYRPDLVTGPPWTNITNAITLVSSLRQIVLESSQPGFYRLAPLVAPSGMELVWIGPGMFSRGVGDDLKLPDSLAEFDEQPQHPVTLASGFYILKDKVSPSQYAASGLPGAASDVSWNNAAAFCAWLSQQEGQTYRLPTEAEWEYAYKNPPGLLNVGGREWVNDWHQLYPHESVTNPAGPAQGILKVIRAGAESRISLPPDATSSPWGFAATSFRVVLDAAPAASVPVAPPPFNQAAVKQSPAPALLGPNPSVPYFTVRYALPLPPDNDRSQNGPLTGLDQSVVDHNHSPGFEILPNGDALAVWFSGVNGDEYGAGVRIVQARLRQGAEEFDMPELLYKIKGYNDESPCLWREGTTNWLFVGGRMGLNYVPFKVGVSTNNGVTWALHLPYLTGSPNFGAMTAQPINNAFRAPNGAMYLAMDGGGADSFLWRSLDNGITWNDQLGRTSGRHSTIVPLDGAGNLLSYGGKNSQINGYMPQNLSANWGATWNAQTQSPFPELGSNQRPSLWRLANGKLVMVGDSQLRGTSTPPAGWTNGPGAYVAISANNGSTWHIKSLPVTLPHESDKLAGTLGYATVRQSPNGVIHVLSTMTHPCLHYEFNEAWVYSSSGDILPETSGGSIQSFSENYPGGALRATWSARSTPNGRYLLDGLETTYHANGQKEHEATWVSGRRTGTETFWSPEGTKIWSWTHNPAGNTSTWIHYWSNGRKRVESIWNTYPAARDLPARNFRGLVAHGSAYHWNVDGTGRGGYSFSNGTLTGTLSAPPAQP